MRALPSPIGSLPTELISKIIHFISRPRALNRTPSKDLVSASVLSKNWREPAERALYTEVIISSAKTLAILSQLAADDHRFNYITSLFLLASSFNRDQGPTSTQISTLQLFVSHIPRLTRLTIESTDRSYRALVKPILINSKHLEYLNLGEPVDDFDDPQGVTFSLEGIDSLLSLSHLVVTPRIIGDDWRKFFGNSIRPNLLRLEFVAAHSSDIHGTFEYLPNLQELTIYKIDDSNFISSLPTSINHLTVTFGEHLINQFKDQELNNLTHITISWSVRVEEFDSLSNIPAILEFSITLACNNAGTRLRDALKKYEVGALRFKKFIFSGFGRGDPKVSKETLWNEIVVECDRLGVGVQRV